MNNKGRIFVIADLHGSVANIGSCLAEIQHPTEDDVIIVAGDAGLEYGGVSSDRVKEIMSGFPGVWIIMRGNHDDRYWEKHTHYEGEVQVPNECWEITEGFEGNSDICYDSYLVEKKYPNIWYVVDEGDIYNIKGRNILFIPGAFSVDKQIRELRGWPYEPKEQLTKEELNYLYKVAKEHTKICKGKIHYVVSHTCPYLLENQISNLFLAEIPQHKIDKSMEQYLDKFAELLENKMTAWCFGHFHNDRTINDKYHMIYKKPYQIGE